MRHGGAVILVPMVGRRLRVLALLVLVCACWLLPLQSASAHTSLVGSTPTRAESVSETPERVVLEFNEPVQVGANGVTVTDGTGAEVGSTALLSLSGTVVTVLVSPDARPGQWTTTYQVRAGDQHVVDGELRFGVGAEFGDIGAGSFPPSLALALVVLVATAGAVVMVTSAQLGTRVVT